MGKEWKVLLLFYWGPLMMFGGYRVFFVWKKLFGCRGKTVRLKEVVGEVALTPYLAVAPIMDLVALICGFACLLYDPENMLRKYHFSTFFSMFCSSMHMTFVNTVKQFRWLQLLRVPFFVHL